MPRHPETSPSVKSLSAAVYSDLAARARRAGGPVYPLHVGDTYLDPLPAARAESQRTADHARLHNYSPVQGEPALLDAILARHDHAFAREELQVMLGATCGIAVVCATLVDPGDEVIVLSPYWPLIRGVIAARGATAVELPLYDRLGAPAFDAGAAIAGAISERTTAIYVNSPNNPTGRVLPAAALDAIAELAARHDLWLIADEAYEALCYVEPAPPPVWLHPGLRERAVVTHTLSKSHGLAGARVGYTHGPPAAMRAIRAAQTFLTYCAPRPMQIGAARALVEGDAWVAEARARYIAAGRATADALGVEPPQGGTFLFFDARPHLAPGEDLAGFLGRCADAGVLLTPGRSCGAAYADWARLCFTAVPPAELDAALARLRPLLRR